MEEEKNVSTSIEETEEIQTVLDMDDEFLKASLEDENVEVNLNVETDVEGIGAVENEGIGSAYAPRLTAPSTTDKNWLHYTKGGYNYCILISGSSCIPNCVGYAWGRWREILGAYHKLSRANAENWWGNTGDGYQRGQIPKVGAVICWRKGQAGNAADGAGHVAIVEKVNSDGSITTSNSGYGGTRFWTATYKYPYNVGSNYYFQGFIYNPAVKEETPTQPVKDPFAGVSDEELARRVWTGEFGNGQDRKNALGSRYNAVQSLVDKGVGKPAPIPQPAPAPSNSLKIGDRVKIVGTGNGSSYGNSNTAGGIGWERQILKVWDGRPFPYQVGNSTGTTGFYKASALQKL